VPRQQLATNETTKPPIIAAVLLVMCVFMHIPVFICFYSSCSNNIKWFIIFNNIFFIGSDFVFLLKVPKHPSLKVYIFLTVILCVFHCIGSYVWCRNDGEYIEQGFYIFNAGVLFFAYAIKLLLLLRYFFVKLHLNVIFDYPNVIHVYPVPLFHFTRKLVVAHKDLSLYILMLVIEQLEKIFLNHRSQVLADDDPNKEIYYDERMDITAMYIKTKQQLLEELQKHKQDYNDLQKEFDQYKKNTESNKNELEKELKVLQKNLAKTKKVEPLECCVCRDEQPNVLLLPCKHLVLCKECVMVIKKTKNLCPVCRKTIKEHSIVFFS